MKIKEKLSKSIESEGKRDRKLSKSTQSEGKREGREDWGPHAREARGGLRGPFILVTFDFNNCSRQFRQTAAGSVACRTDFGSVWT